LLEEVYNEIKPYAKKHPNLAVYYEGNVCPVCTSKNMVKNGKYHSTNANLYQSVRCKDCGAFARMPQGTLLQRQRQALYRSL